MNCLDCFTDCLMDVLDIEGLSQINNLWYNPSLSHVTLEICPKSPHQYFVLYLLQYPPKITLLIKLYAVTTNHRTDIQQEFSVKRKILVDEAGAEYDGTGH